MYWHRGTLVAGAIIGSLGACFGRAADRCRALHRAEVDREYFGMMSPAAYQPVQALERRLKEWGVQNIPSAELARYRRGLDTATIEAVQANFAGWTARAERPSDSTLSILSAVVDRRLRYLDSMADLPPLRPSDRAWYDEHCWQGKPR